MRYVVTKEFTDSPGGRCIKSGKHSGEEFRQSHLLPLLAKHKHVTIVLDGASGYACCFLEEAFGGIVRHQHYTADQLKSKITFVSDEEPQLIEEILVYIEDAE